METERVITRTRLGLWQAHVIVKGGFVPASRYGFTQRQAMRRLDRLLTGII